MSSGSVHHCPSCGRVLTPVRLRHESGGPQPAAYECDEHGLFDLSADGRLVAAAVGTHDEPFRRGDPTLDDDEFA
jgi:hypothetical protein